MTNDDEMSSHPYTARVLGGFAGSPRVPEKNNMARSMRRSAQKQVWGASGSCKANLMDGIFLPKTLYLIRASGLSASQSAVASGRPVRQSNGQEKPPLGLTPAA
jgi:hypothetical protein